MRKPRIQPDEDDEQKSWDKDETPEKYEALTMGDNEDQDSEETLAVQSDARETVEEKAPAMRTRGRSGRVTDGDTRQDAGIKLDSPNESSEEVNPPPRRRPTRVPAPPKAFAGKGGKGGNGLKNNKMRNQPGRTQRNPKSRRGR